MSEPLRSILRQLDYSREPMWEHSQVEQWPDGQLETCLATSLLVPDKPATHIACSGCGAIVDVLIRSSIRHGPAAYLRCGDCGPVRVPIEYVSCWRLDVSRFLTLLTAALGIPSPPQEIVLRRVWRLGRWRCGGASRYAYLACQLQRRDVRQVIDQAAFPQGAVVFVPTTGPRPELAISSLPLIVPLIDVLDWSGAELVIDQAHVADQLALAGATSDRKLQDAAPRKQDSRLAAQGALKRELIEHLRSARDYALETQRRTGTPQLLPRPTKEQLATRIGVHRTTVSRCLEDGLAPDLMALWNLAANVDRILSHAA